MTKFFSSLTSFEVLSDVIGLTIVLFLTNIWFLITTIGIYCFHYDMSSIGDTMVKCLFSIGVVMAILFNKDEELYDDLKKKYENERHSKIKGYGVLAYVIFTFASLFYCLYYNT